MITINSNKITIVSIIMIVSAALVASLVSCAKTRDRITIKGSSTVLPIMIKASEKYSEKYGTSFSVTGTGSGDGISALINGLCDIAMSSRSIQNDEMELARNKNLDLDEEIIGYDMITIIVHPSNPVNNLTIEQIRGIYDGNIKNWKEFGGPDMKIVVISRDSSSGTQSVFSRRIIKPEKIDPHAVMMPTNGAMLFAVAGNPKGIGYIGFGYLDKTVKAVSVNGIMPKPRYGASGQYPISRKLYLYVNRQKSPQKVITFMDFLMSEDGQKAVSDAGYLPL